MNRVYRLVFNRKLGVVQVASELGSRQRASSGRSKSDQRPVVRILFDWVTGRWSTLCGRPADNADAHVPGPSTRASHNMMPRVIAALAVAAAVLPAAGVQAQTVESSGDVVTSAGGGVLAPVPPAGPSWVFGQLILGVGAISNGSLTVRDGGQLLSGQGIVGWNPGSAGTATVTGIGSEWRISEALWVGGWGSGELVVSNGGRVLSGIQAHLGSVFGSVGTARVFGEGSLWETAGGLAIGYEGTGTLFIDQGGRVAAYGVEIGSEVDSVGALHLQGGAQRGRGVLETGGVSKGLGTASLSLDGGILRAARNNNNFLNGFGALALGANGVVFDTNGFDIGVGTSFSSTAATSGLTKQGAGTLNLTGQSSIGGAVAMEAGTLRLQNGGKLAATEVLIDNTDGNTVGSTARVVVDGPGTLWQVSPSRSRFVVGDRGTGQLEVTNGGHLVSKLSLEEGFVTGSIGRSAGSSGSATVSGVAADGTASRWDMNNLDVGGHGTGTLHVSDGGQVTTTGLVRVGREQGGVGTLTLSGADTLLTNPAGQGFTVGDAGFGVFSVEGGARAQTAVAGVGQQAGSVGRVVITGADALGNASEWAISGGLMVGRQGVADVLVSNGGRISSQTGAIGSTDALGVASVTVTGAKSQWNMTSLLNLTASNVSDASATLTVAEGGLVSASSVNLADDSPARPGTATLNVWGSEAAGRGVVEARFIRAAAPDTVNLNIDGGVLRATQTQTNYLQNFTDLALGANGLVFDTQSFNVGVSTALSSAVAGQGGLIKQGSGVLTLSGANTYAGNTLINTGTLRMGRANALGSSTAVTLANTSGALWDLAGNNQSIAALSGGGTSGGNIALGGATLTVGSDNGSTTYAGAISSNGQLVKQGAGTLTVTGNNTYSGGTTISGGTLDIISNQNLGNAAGGVTVSNNAALRLSSGYVDLGARAITLGTGGGTLSQVDGATMVVRGAISGDKLTKNGGGSLTLFGDNTYSGGTQINAGTLNLYSAATLGTGAVQIVAGAFLNFARSTAGTLGNDISGAGRVNQTGAGTVTLTGNNTYGGQTTVNSGATLQVGDGGSTGTLGSGTVSNNGVLVFNRADALSVANVITGSGRLVQNSSGTSVLSGDSSAFAGDTLINAGALAVNGRLGGSVTVNDGGSLRGAGWIGGDVTVTSGGTLSAGNSPGTLQINGDLTLSSGSTSLFELGQPGVVGGANNDLVEVGGDLKLAGTLQAQAASAGWYRVFNYGGDLSGTFDATQVSSSSAGFNVRTTTLHTGVDGQVNLYVLGAGQTAQHWNGAVTTPGGARVVGGSGTWSGFNSNWTDATGASAEGWGGSVAIFGGDSGGTVNVQGQVDFDTLQFNTNGYVLQGDGDAATRLYIRPAQDTTARINVASGVSAEIAASIESDSGSGSTSLYKVGGGALSLTGRNKIAGLVYIDGGLLKLESGGQIVSSYVGVGQNAGTVGEAHISGAGSSWLTGNGTFAVGGWGSGTLTVSDGAQLRSSRGSIGYIDGGFGEVTVTGVGSLWSTGADYLAVGDVGSGTLDVLDGGEVFSERGYVGQGSPYSAAGAGVALISGAGSAWNIRENLYVGDGATGTLTIEKGGVVSAERVMIGSRAAGNGTLKVLGDAVNDRGVVEATRLEAGPGSAALHVDGGILRARAAESDFLRNFNSVDLGANGVAFDSNGFDIGVGTAFAGQGGMIKQGAGTLTLRGVSLYTGATSINSGILRMGVTNALGSLTAVDLANAAGAQWDLAGFNQRVGSLSSGGLQGGNVTLGGATLTVGSSNTNATYAGFIDGSGGLVKEGTGTWVLSGKNTYGGLTSVNAGTLQIGDGGTTGALGVGVVRIAAGASLAFDRSSNLFVGNVIEGDGGLDIAGTGAIALTGANSYTGITNIRARATLQVGSGSTGELGSGAVVNNGALIFAGQFARSVGNAISGLGVVAFGGGETTITGNNTYAGSTQIGLNQASHVRIGNGGIAGTLGMGSVIFAVPGGSLTFDRSNTLIMGNAITGNGWVIQAGTGTTVLTGDSSYSGGTTVSGGTLQVGNGGLTGSLGNGAVSISSGATLALNRSNDFSVGNVITGDGSVTKLGAGTLTLSGDSSYSGGTAVNDGTLLVNGSIAADVQVNTGGTLGGSGVIGNHVTIASGGTLAAGNSPGTLTIAGDLTLQAGSTSGFELGQAGVIGGVSNDLVTVGGDLSLGGSLQAHASSAGAYRLFNYGGDMRGAFDAEAVLGGAGFTVASYTLDTSVHGQVNLLVLGAAQTVQYWNGAVATPGGGSVIGGSGTWTGFNNNWTDASGATAAAWGGSVGIFGGATGGAVGVQGAVDFDTLQFNTNGYVLTGDASNGDQLQIHPASGNQGRINVSAGIAAEIAASIVDGSDGNALVKVGGGTLVLSAENTYSGGTTVAEGTLVAAASGALGTAAARVEGSNALLQVVQDVALTNSITLANNATLDNAGTIATGSAGIAGQGQLINRESGLIQGDVNLDDSATNRVTLYAGSQIDGVLDIGTHAESTLTLNGVDAVAQRYSAAVAGATTFAGTLTVAGGSTGSWTLDRDLAVASTRVEDGATLQLGDGGIAGGVGGGTIVNDGILVLNRSDDLTLANAMSGSGELVKEAANTVTLSGVHSGDGSTFIQRGTLALSGAGSLGSGALYLGTGGAATLDLSAANGDRRVGSLSGVAGTSVVLGANTLAFGDAGNHGYAGVIQGSGGITKHGTGVQILTGVSTYRGTTTVAAGTLALSGAGTLGTGAVRLIADNAQFDIAAADAARSIGALDGIAGSRITLGANALSINQSADGSFAGEVTGSGSLTKSGSARLTLSGANSHTGQTTINAGTLVLDGSVAGAATVNNGGTLAGVGRVAGNVLVASGGTLSPGNSPGTFTIDGNLTLAAGSTYAVDLGANAWDKTRVGGSASLQGGSLKVTALDAEVDYREGTVYTVLQANGGVQGQFSALVNQSAFLNVIKEYTANSVNLRIANFESLASAAETANQLETASALDSLGNSAAELALYNSLLLLDAAQARAAFDGLAGQVHASTRSALLDNRFLHAGVEQRLQGAVWGNQSGQGTVWFSAGADQQRVAADGNGARNATQGEGARVGADWQLSEAWLLGAALGSQELSHRLLSNAERAKSKETAWGVYAQGQWNGWRLAASVSRSDYRIDTTRVALLQGNAVQPLAARSDAEATTTELEIAHSWALEKASWQPYLRLTQTQLDSDAVLEHGGNPALAVESGKYDRLTSTLGVRGNWQAASRLSLQYGVGWQHASGDLHVGSQQRFAVGGNAFSILAAEQKGSSIVAELGATLRVGKHGSLGWGVQSRNGDSHSNLTGNVTLRVGF